MSNIDYETKEDHPGLKLTEDAWPGLLIAALGIGGAALCALALTRGYFTGYAVFSPTRWALLGGGAGAVLLATLIKYSLSGTLAAGARFVGIVAQVALVYLVFETYQLESPLFRDFLLPAVLAGFIANHFTPDSLRPSFFLAVSLGAMFAIFGLLDGAIMLGLGLVLFGICHLPVTMWKRVALILGVAVVLGLVRAGVIPMQRLNTILPILSSIFMFRLVIYLYDLHSGKGPKSPAMHLSYFFMLPNFAFPFFPVVDFSSWGRSFQSAAEIETYQRGAMWLLIGAVHLLLYRVVNYYLAIDPVDVAGFWSFLYYAITNFGLYLKISGLFHTILGMLFLFGFALPETHSRYYLSNSFIDFWRRINIYWKDFMQKTVFTPVFVWLKHRGLTHMNALVLSITAVFFVTWATHAYQWFWLLGTLLLTAPDVLFWSLLGVLLIVQTIDEARPVKPDAVARIGPQALLIIRTVSTMLTIVILWSLWSSESLHEWLALVAVAGVPLLDGSAPWNAANILISAGFLAFLFALFAITMGYTFGLAPPGSHPKPSPLARRRKAYQLDRAAGFVAVSAGALMLAQLPQVYNQFPRDGALFVVDMGTARLSARDQDQLQRGYYENLTDAKMINSELWLAQGQQGEDWRKLSQTNGVVPVDDLREIVMVPNFVFPFQGSVMSTNSLGMRDKEYSIEKPPGVARIGLVGDSRGMGYSIPGNATFEKLVEDRLNDTGDVPVEILNFSVGGHRTIMKAMLFEENALPMSPDAIIFMAHQSDMEILAKIVDFYEADNLPFDFLYPILKESGVQSGMSETEIQRRLNAVSEEINAQVYRWVADTAREAGITPVWMFLPSTAAYPDPPEEGVILRRLAEEAGFEIIDLSDIYNDVEPENYWVRPWDDHPNVAGHRLIADRLESALKDIPPIRGLLSKEASEGQSTQQ